MAEDVVSSVSVAQASAILQGRGFRAELVPGTEEGPVIRSASNGLAFEMRLFSKLPNQADAFLDLTFTAGFKLRAAPAPEMLNRWNGTRRFARVFGNDDMLVLAMDVALQGGVTEAHLRGKLDLWDRLLQDLLTVLRAEAAPAAPEVVN